MWVKHFQKQAISRWSTIGKDDGVESIHFARFSNFYKFNTLILKLNHRRNEEKDQGSLPPNKEQIGANKEQKWDQNGAFLGIVFHENTSSNFKFKSKGAE